MTPTRLAAALLPLALAACGGTSASQFQDAAPSYAALAMDTTGAATTGGMSSGPAMAVASPAAAALDPAPADAMALTTVDCHPHLFLRTADLAMRVNRHLWKFLRHVEVLSMRHPDHVDGGSAAWQRTQGNMEVRWTITRVSDQVFGWLLEARSAAHPDWLAVFSGRIDRTGAAGPHQGKGNARLDLTALQAVDPMEPSSGVIDAAFETFPDHRTLVVDAKAVLWDPNALAWFIGTPADAHYVYHRVAGKGGSFKAHDSMVFACPSSLAVVSPPPADVKLLSRWFLDAAAYHGRSDALMTGGQLTAASRVEGLTCQTANFDMTPTAEAYWLMKEEASSAPFGTLQSWGPLGDPAACASAFGPVPAVADASSDFDFATVDFDSAAPAPFPGGP